MLTERSSSFSALAQVKTFEGLINQKYRLRREQPKREQGTFALSLRESANGYAHQRCQLEVGDYLPVDVATARKKSKAVVENPAYRLFSPRSDAIRDVE